MSTYYRQLMDHQMIPQELKRFISVIDLSSAKMNCDAATLMPDMLWNVKNSEYDYALKLFSLYMQESGMDFSGEVPCLHIKPEKGDAQKNINQFSDAFILAGGYRRFKGIIHIDIQEYAKSVKDSSFSRIMSFIRKETEGCIRILTAKLREYQEKEIEDELKLVTRLKTIHFNNERATGQHIFLKIKLEEAGFTITDAADQAIVIMLNQFSQHGNIQSLSDVSILADDILLFALEQGFDTPIISEDTVNMYFKQCSLFKQKGNKNRQHIGFVRGDD